MRPRRGQCQCGRAEALGAADMQFDTSPDPADELLAEIEQSEQLAALIIAYAAAETVNGVMTQDEVKPLRKGDRLKHLRNGLFLATVRYCRRCERPDIALAMLVVVQALSDNDEGCCWISFGRLARLLNCSKRAVRAARERLEGHGLLLVTERPGDDGDNDTNLVWLAVPSKLANVRPLQVVEALASPSQPKRATKENG
jgi:Helix-turn-helix domain